MRIFTNKAFSKWAVKEKLDKSSLLAAVEEMAQGLVDADLGGHVFKKRVAVGGRGKRGGLRTLLVYRVGDRAFFVHGFAKNVQANISDKELKGLKHLATELLSYSNSELNEAVKNGALIEVGNDG